MALSHTGTDSSQIFGKTVGDNVRGSSVTATMMKPAFIPKLMNASYSGIEQNILDFLQKPVRLHTGVFSTTDTIGTFWALGGVLYQDIINKPTYKDKLRGHLGFKATTVLKLMCNANMFQQGRYILATILNGGMEWNTTNYNKWLLSHRYTIMQISQLPHVELDLACDTEVTLRIPFISTESCYPIRAESTGGPGSLGSFFISPYSPLVSPSGTTTASWSLWCHFEDIELFGPTVGQMSWNPSSKKLNAQAREKKEGNIGPISGPASTLSKAAGIVSSIPLLTPYAGMAQWAADLIAGAASAVGYSKPAQEQEVTRISRFMFPYMNCVDGIDNSFKVGWSAKNCVETIPGFAGTEIDEMTFVKFGSTWSWVLNINWVDTDAVDALLANLPISPVQYADTTDDTKVVRSYPPIGFIAAMFSQWRGSIEYRIKFVKTPLHSGRLTASYVPWDPRIAVPTITEELKTKVHREIIDIREGSEFSMLVPYVANTPYLSTEYTTGCGYVQLSVLDPLTRPSTCSNTIKLIVEVRGGPDIEFACPKVLSASPYLPTSAQMDWRPECEILTTTIGGSHVQETEDSFARLCVGEKIVSFRSMLKAFNHLPYYGGASGANATVNPFALVTVASSGAGGVWVTNNSRPDLYSWLGMIFALSRGSVRLKMDILSSQVSATQNNKCNVYLRNHVITDTFNQIITAGGGVNSLGTHNMFPIVSFDTSMTSGVEIEVPSYNKTISRSNGELLTYTQDAVPWKWHMPMYDVYFELDSTSVQRWFRAGGDDCEFGCFMSIPPSYTQ